MSSRRPPLRVDVARTVDRFLGLMASEGGPKLRGLYLVGSVALGDFRPGRSNIDFVACLDGPLSGAETEALARVHAALARAGGPHFDGFYLPIEALRHPPEPDAVVPFSVDGQLRSGEPCHGVNPATWRCLARSSRPILGATPAALNIADDDATLHAYGLAHLEAHWRPWLVHHETALAGKAPDDACDAGALEWGVLGVGDRGGLLPRPRDDGVGGLRNVEARQRVRGLAAGQVPVPRMRLQGAVGLRGIGGAEDVDEAVLRAEASGQRGSAEDDLQGERVERGHGDDRAAHGPSRQAPSHAASYGQACRDVNGGGFGRTLFSAAAGRGTEDRPARAETVRCCGRRRPACAIA